jgi:hypothetical protein
MMCKKCGLSRQIHIVLDRFNFMQFTVSDLFYDYSSYQNRIHLIEVLLVLTQFENGITAHNGALEIM